MHARIQLMCDGMIKVIKVGIFRTYLSYVVSRLKLGHPWSLYRRSI